MPDAMLRVHDESQAAVLVAMHQTLSRRQHGLIGEMLEHLTLLQKATEDAELLDRSFKIDHLSTRLRRMVESVSVVLGGESLRETRAPVPIATLLRGAKSEVVKYTRGGVPALGVRPQPDHQGPDVEMRWRASGSAAAGGSAGAGDAVVGRQARDPQHQDDESKDDQRYVVCSPTAVLVRRFRSVGLWARIVACGLGAGPVVSRCSHRVTRRRCPFHDDTAI
ncbi:hypothetical protein [Streptomyces sp. NPDC020951]|uniref:hypothetical protein n=1 Tax=Streptomyces sp. NPDC020951 TaxID=3365104 RepID=UPI0037B47020